MAAVRVEGLRKTYGKAAALDGLDLEVPEGAISALLGPNGAGKTTLIRILATLLRPDGGRAEVCGHDVVSEPRRIRALIGLTGQYAAVDELLTARENLVLVGRLAGLTAARARARAAELMELFELEERRAGTYSGGLRRRLDLAASLMTRPRVLFLDEPTAGLDPRSRRTLWATIERLPAQGTTILLTTQYLEEADRLAGTVTVIDRGRVVACGSPAELKARVGGTRAEIVLADPAQAGLAVAAMGAYGEPRVRDGDVVTVPSAAGGLPGLLRDLDAAGVRVLDLALRGPTLDDAFLALTGHRTEEDR